MTDRDRAGDVPPATTPNAPAIDDQQGELVSDLHGYGMMMPDYYWTGDTYISMRALGRAPIDVTRRALPPADDVDVVDDTR